MTCSPKDATKARRSKKKILKPRSVSRSRVCRTPRPGQKCPYCGEGKLAYDGLLQLACPVCRNVASGGGFT